MSDFYPWGRRHNDKVFNKSVLLNEHTCSVLFSCMLELLCSILSAIYAASSFCNHVPYYITDVNRVVHFAELVNTCICVRIIIILSLWFKKTASATILALKRNVTFIMTGTVYAEAIWCFWHSSTSFLACVLRRRIRKMVGIIVWVQGEQEIGEEKWRQITDGPGMSIFVL